VKNFLISMDSRLIKILILGLSTVVSQSPINCVIIAWESSQLWNALESLL
jgi:hypothetical protein